MQIPFSNNGKNYQRISENCRKRKQNQKNQQTNAIARKLLKVLCEIGMGSCCGVCRQRHATIRIEIDQIGVVEYQHRWIISHICCIIDDVLQNIPVDIRRIYHHVQQVSLHGCGHQNQIIAVNYIMLIYVFHLSLFALVDGNYFSLPTSHSGSQVGA